MPPRALLRARLDSNVGAFAEAETADEGAGALSLKTNDGGKGGLLSFGAKGNVTFSGLANSLTIDGKKYELVTFDSKLRAAAQKYQTNATINFGRP